MNDSTFLSIRFLLIFFFSPVHASVPSLENVHKDWFIFIIKQIIDQNKSNCSFWTEKNSSLIKKRQSKLQFKNDIMFAHGAIVDYKQEVITVFDLYCLSLVCKSLCRFFEIHYNLIQDLWLKTNNYENIKDCLKTLARMRQVQKEIDTRFSNSTNTVHQSPVIQKTHIYFSETFFPVTPKITDKNIARETIKRFSLEPFFKIFSSTGTIYLNPKKEPNELIAFAEQHILDRVTVMVNAETLYIGLVNSLQKIDPSSLSVEIGIAQYSKLLLAGSAFYIFEPELQREKFTLKLSGQVSCQLKCNLDKFTVKMSDHTTLKCLGKVVESRILLTHNASIDVSAFERKYVIS